MTSLVLCQPLAATCQRRGGIDARLVLHLSRTRAGAHPDITAESAGERAVDLVIVIIKDNAPSSLIVAATTTPSTTPNTSRQRPPCRTKAIALTSPPVITSSRFICAHSAEIWDWGFGLPSFLHLITLTSVFDLTLGTHHVTPHDLSPLRVLSSVGEPFNLEAWNWCNEHLGGQQCAAVDTQTETDSLVDVITPFSGAVCVPTKPGSASATVPLFGHVPQYWIRLL
ncbi:hypothetical protein B0H13DRAFT_2309086 [Mycena leptocephala]|nr:hypothetical protein B0H13DRAFT_2309086 [Mycena leptocephala]